MTGIGKFWWIASYPKSGNTWLRVFLNAYKTGDAKIDLSGGPFAYDDMSQGLFEKLMGKPEEEASPDEVWACRGAYLQNVLAHVGEGARVFMKTHCANVHAHQWPMIPSVFTEGAFYVVRDPRDVCVSYTHHCQKDNEHTANFMAMEDAMINHGPRSQPVGSWSDHVKSWRTTTNFKTYRLRYEDMQNEPERVFGRVVEVLGWPLDKKRLRWAIDAVSFDECKSQEDDFGYNERATPDTPFFRRGRVGSWREELSPELTAKIEQDHGHMMKELSYGCDRHDFGVPRPYGHSDHYEQDIGNRQIQERG